jgi:hypothetical protein
MLCPVCDNVINRFGAWLASGQIYCSEFCAEADHPEPEQSRPVLHERAPRRGSHPTAFRLSSAVGPANGKKQLRPSPAPR